MTLTQVGNTWPVVRNRMKLVRHRVAATGARWEWCWSVEPNPRGTGHHVHAWQRGDFLPQRELSNIARREGAGHVVDIRRWDQGGREEAGYGLKGVTYGTKLASGEDSAEAFLAANGGRLTHQSRGWWTLGTAKAEEAAAVQLHRAGKPPEWTVVEASHVRRYARLIAELGHDPQGPLGKNRS